MRIAIQLQSWDETVGGIGIYTQEIVRALLRIDSNNEYVLIYPASGSREAVEASSAVIRM